MASKKSALYLRSIVSTRVDELKNLQFDAIRALPEHERQPLSDDPRTVITQYHDVTDSGEHLVIVQALRDRWLGLTTSIEVDGFVADKSGLTRPLTDSETWKYT